MILLWLGLGLVLLFGLTALIGAPYVPSHGSAVRKAFTELRPLEPGDLVVDIGSGDGAVLRHVGRLGARGYGIEINPILVLISKLRLRRYKHLITIKTGNLWQATFPPDTTIVYTFGESRDIKKMFDKVQRESDRLHRPLEFMSYGFSVPNEQPQRVAHGFYMYRVLPLQRPQT